MQIKTISVSGICLVPIDPSLLAQCPLGDEVDVAAEQGALVIRPVPHLISCVAGLATAGKLRA